MQFYYYAALFGVGTVSVFAGQKYSRSTKTYYDILIYTLLTGVMACGVFAVSAGFKFTLDVRIFMYSAVYAVAGKTGKSAGSINGRTDKQPDTGVAKDIGKSSYKCKA
jgi:hypothetical protein